MNTEKTFETTYFYWELKNGKPTGKLKSKKCKSPLFLDYVLSTSFSTYRQAEGYEPRLRYEVSSVTRACEQFAA